MTKFLHFRREDELVIRDHNAETASSSRRRITACYLSLVAAATLGWLYAIVRGTIVVAEWLVG